MSEAELPMKADAWSDGQVRSKLWLCQFLEKEFSHHRQLKIWILGSWYGLVALFLLSRQRVQIHTIHFFDIDREALQVSQKILEHWRLSGINLHFHQQDCTAFNAANFISQSGAPDVVINTSCEHFSVSSWLKDLPLHTKVIVQSTNMSHATHLYGSSSLEQFSHQLEPWLKVSWKEEIKFVYPSLSFSRYMVFGRRHQRAIRSAENITK